ncbi:Uncharacterised protein [Mycobacterium tuberculosis]|nr:Uncharacterised protein [Mycobacterium tuberculosis]
MFAECLFRYGGAVERGEHERYGVLAVGEHGACAAGGEGCGAADGGEEANGHFVGDDGASVDESGEGSLVFVVAVADDFAVALVGDTALVGAVPGLANDLRYGDGNFGEGVVGAHQLIIAYCAGLRLVAGHLLAVAGLVAGLTVRLAAGATIERWFGVYFVFVVGEFLAHKNTGIHIRYSAPYQKFTPFKTFPQAKMPII